MSQPTFAPAAVAPVTASLVPASLGRRVGAYAIDLAIAYVLTLIVVFAGIAIIRPSAADSNQAVVLGLLGLYGAVVFVLIAWNIVYTFLQGGRGSIGQRLVKIQLRDAGTAAPIGFWRAFLRNIIWGLAASIVVGYFSVLFDSSGRRQGWHDKVANAMVVNATDAAAPAVAPVPAPAYAAPILPGQPTGAAPAFPGRPAGSPVPEPVFPIPEPVEGFSGFAAPPAAPAPPAGGFFPATHPVAPPAPPAPPTAPFGSAPAAPSAAPAPAGSMISSVPGITIDPEGVAAAVADASRPAPPPPPAAFAAPEHTIPGAVFAAMGTPAPAAAPAASGPATADLDIDETRAASAVSPAIAVLVWDDGTRTAVYTRTLFGRNPSSDDGAVAAAIRDETLSLSKTHFEVGPGSAGAYVLDRHSTNGTTLVRDGGRQLLVPGTQTTLIAGDVLEFGDRRATVGGGS